MIARGAALMLLGACAAVPEGRWTASPLAQWDARFSREDTEWRGADAAYSVPLSKDRILWLFGDTIVVPPGSKGRSGAKMPRNTIAIQKLPDPPKFFWSTQDGQPCEFFKPEAGEGWLWPLSGVRTGASLRLFMMQMLPKEGGGAFGFRFSRSVLLSVENPDDDPTSWKMRQIEIPHCVKAEHGTTYFGGGSMLQGDQLYVYGLREGRKGPDAILARVAAASVTDFSSWRFFDGREWNPELPKAREMFPGASVEMSVSSFQDGFAAVYSQLGLSPEIVVRRAPLPEGPWSDATVVFRCPEVDWNRKYFCYAGKAHPELATRPNELIVTYACNSHEFWDPFKDLRIYRPRFVRVALE